MQERRWERATKKPLETSKGFLEEVAHVIEGLKPGKGVIWGQVKVR